MISSINPATNSIKEDVFDKTVRLLGGLPDADVDALMARLDQMKLERLTRRAAELEKLAAAARSEFRAIDNEHERLMLAIAAFRERGVTLSQVVQS